MTIETLPPAAALASATPVIAADDPARFINRELSWLDFNTRVLEEAANARHPLLERLRFVAISAANLDEFYSVRVAGLVGQSAAGIATLSPDGLTPAQQLAVVTHKAQELIGLQQQEWRKLRELLSGAGIIVAEAHTLSDTDRDWLADWFVHEGGWSLKSLHRMLLTSQAWRLSLPPRRGITDDLPQGGVAWRMTS
jgi:polyphosphate kinase